MKLGRILARGAAVFAISEDAVAWLPLPAVGLHPATTADAIGAYSAWLACGRAWSRARTVTDPPLLTPIVGPRRVLGVGFNFAEHATELRAAESNSPVFFARFAASLAGPYDDVFADLERFPSLDYEAELGVVLGPRTNGMDSGMVPSIFGYVVANDLTVRALQHHDPQVLRAKAVDGSCPIGPWVTTADEVGDLAPRTIRAWVNGDLRQEARLDALVRPPSALLRHFDEVAPLSCGDVVLTGSPGGAGAGLNPPRFLTAGDVVRCEIDGLGAIENKIVSELVS